MNKKIGILMFLLMFALYSCSGLRLNKKQMDAMGGAQIPFSAESPFAPALRRLGEWLKKTNKGILYVGAGPIQNLTPSRVDIPYNYQIFTELSLGKLGSQIICVPGPSREVTITDQSSGRSLITRIPNITVDGALLSYDDGIHSKDRGGELDTHVGGGHSETDGSVDAGDGEWVERATLGLEVIDHTRGGIILPGNNITLAVDLLRISKQGGVSLRIYGNGILFQERISQSTPKGMALSCLTDASVFYLFCNYFGADPAQFIDKNALSEQVEQSLQKDLQPIETSASRKNDPTLSMVPPDPPEDLNPAAMYQLQRAQDSRVDSSPFNDQYESDFDYNKCYKPSKFQWQEEER